MLTRILLTVALAIPTTFFGTPPWEKAPEKSDMPTLTGCSKATEVKFDTKSTYRYTDRQTGRVEDSSFNRDLTPPVRGIELTRARMLRPIPVLWWSS
jgi:hypothetical protein